MPKSIPVVLSVFLLALCLPRFLSAGETRTVVDMRGVEVTFPADPGWPP
jgi:hypothetical protein